MRTEVNVPAMGYVVVRFKADNPGIWMFHCHILSHMLEGQTLLFRVADKGIKTHLKLRYIIIPSTIISTPLYQGVLD